MHQHFIEHALWIHAFQIKYTDVAMSMEINAVQFALQHDDDLYVFAHAESSWGPVSCWFLSAMRTTASETSPHNWNCNLDGIIVEHCLRCLATYYIGYKCVFMYSVCRRLCTPIMILLACMNTHQPQLCVECLECFACLFQHLTTWSFLHIFLFITPFWQMENTTRYFFSPTAWTISKSDVEIYPCWCHHIASQYLCQLATCHQASAASTSVSTTHSAHPFILLSNPKHTIS